MERVIAFKPHTSLVSDTTSVQRLTYFVLGFGLIVTALMDPPATTAWMALANTVGIALVVVAIMGKRIMPEMRGSRYLREPRIISNSTGLMLGLGISVFAIAQPPVITAWATYMHIVAIALVTQAIIGYDFLMTQKKAAQSGHKPSVTKGDKEIKMVTDFPKAA
jgi:hypothetical protein